MSKTITIQPITRIEGHASIHIQLDDQGDVTDARVAFKSLRGFEKFVEGGYDSLMTVTRNHQKFGKIIKI